MEFRLCFLSAIGEIFSVLPLVCSLHFRSQIINPTFFLVSAPTMSIGQRMRASLRRPTFGLTRWRSGWRDARIKCTKDLRGRRNFVRQQSLFEARKKLFLGYTRCGRVYLGQSDDATSHIRQIHSRSLVHSDKNELYDCPSEILAKWPLLSTEDVRVRVRRQVAGVQTTAGVFTARTSQPRRRRSRSRRLVHRACRRSARTRRQNVGITLCELSQLEAFFQL